MTTIEQISTIALFIVMQIIFGLTIFWLTKNKRRSVSQITNEMIIIYRHSLTLGYYGGAYFRSLPLKMQKKALGL